MTIHRELLCRTQIIAEVVDTVDPEASLHDLPVEHAIFANESVELGDDGFIQISETHPTLWSNAGEFRNKSWKDARNAPGRGVGNQRGDARLERGSAGSEMPTETPPAQSDTVGVDVRLCDREINDGSDHCLPIRTEVSAMLIQHLTLPWAVKE